MLARPSWVDYNLSPELIFSTFGFQRRSFCYSPRVFAYIPTVRTPARVCTMHSLRRLPCLQNVKPTHNLQPSTCDERNLFCNIAEVELCTTTQTPDFTWELYDRQPLFSGIVYSKCQAPPTNHQQPHQIVLICSPIVQSENGVYHKEGSVVVATEENVSLSATITLASHSGCQNMGMCWGDASFKWELLARLRSPGVQHQITSQGKKASQEYQPHKIVYVRLTIFFTTLLGSC